MFRFMSILSSCEQFTYSVKDAPSGCIECNPILKGTRMAFAINRWNVFTLSLLNCLPAPVTNPARQTSGRMTE